jgi:hypothetical protein
MYDIITAHHMKLKAEEEPKKLEARKKYRVVHTKSDLSVHKNKLRHI